MAATEKGEIILFKTPKLESTLCIENTQNISIEQLFELFQPFGLLYDIKEFCFEETKYAFVKYYSKLSAQTAQTSLNKVEFNGKPLKANLICKTKANIKTVSFGHKSLCGIGQVSCVVMLPTIASYFIGFNQWFTSILVLSQDTLEFNEETNQFKCTYTCRVRVSLKDGRYTDAEGRATGGGKDKAFVIQYAKKNAVTEARKSAFQMMAIVLLNSGKVAVHFLNDSLEQWE